MSDVSQAPATSPAPTKDTKRVWLIAAVVVGLVLIAATALFLNTRSKTLSKSGVFNGSKPELLKPGPSATGSVTSPVIQSSFILQGELNFISNDNVMKAYLGQRYGGSWIENDGRVAVLNVGVVGLTDGDQHYMEQKTKTFSANTGVELVNVAHSWSSRQGYWRTIGHYSNARPLGTMSGGVYAPDNDIQVMVTPQEKAAAEKIQRLVPAGVVQIQTAKQDFIAAGFQVGVRTVGR